MEKKKRHLFHLVDYSKLPLLVSLGAFFFTMYIVLTTERIELSSVFVYINLIILFICAYNWCVDVIKFIPKYITLDTKVYIRLLVILLTLLSSLLLTDSALAEEVNTPKDQEISEEIKSISKDIKDNKDKDSVLLHTFIIITMLTIGVIFWYSGGTSSVNYIELFKEVINPYYTRVIEEVIQDDDNDSLSDSDNESAG